LWVALVVRRSTHNYWARGLAWAHALITAAVVIGTGNHWILDVAAGWALVIVAMWLVDPWFADSRQQVKVRRLALNRRIAGTAPQLETIAEQAVPEPPAPEPPASPSFGADPVPADPLTADPLTSEADDAWADPPRKRPGC
jgi:hypothetical protein